MRCFPTVALVGAIVLLIVSQHEVRGDAMADGPIRVSPQRLTLGALAYGDPRSTVLVREVKIEGLSLGTSLGTIDLSRASGVQLLDRREIGETTILRFVVNVGQFTKGKPYGLFIKKPIRLETTSPDQPQLLLPVIGWTALNETSRNFNDYLFAGHERWQGMWSTPNIAGSVLAPLLILMLGVAAAIFPDKNSRIRRLKIGASVLLFGCFGVLLGLLLATYSRGAWIAFLSGCVVLDLSSARVRQFAICGLLAFTFVVLLLPSGLKRLDSYAQIQEDPSISHRFNLWIGALQMMGDRPRGVGTGQFGPVFECDYQRFDHVALNSTAVNDYLTVGAEHGIFFLSAILGSVLLVLFLSVRAARARANPWQLTFSAALLAIMVASIFSTLWFVPDYQMLSGFILAALLICLAIQNWRSCRRNFVGAIALETTFVCGSFLVLTMMALSSLLLQPTRSLDVSMTNRLGNSFFVHCIEPRWHKPKGVIIYFRGERDALPVLCHSTLRTLAALGWQVWSSDSFPEDNSEFTAVVASTAHNLPLFVAGQNEGGRLAWVTAARSPRSVIRAGAGLDFLTMDLDPLKGGPVFDTPFLDFQFLYDDQVSANASIRASRRAAFADLPLTTQLSPEESGVFSSGTLHWVECLDHYFSARIAP
jgi:hypothetical protein